MFICATIAIYVEGFVETYKTEKSLYCEKHYEILWNAIENDIVIFGEDELRLSYEVPEIRYKISNVKWGNIKEAYFYYENAEYYLRIADNNEIVYSSRNYSNEEDYQKKLKLKYVKDAVSSILKIVFFEILILYVCFFLIRKCCNENHSEKKEE